MSHTEEPYSGEGLLTDAQALAKARRQLDRQQPHRYPPALREVLWARHRDGQHTHLPRAGCPGCYPDEQPRPLARSLAEPDVAEVVDQLTLPPEQRAKGHIWLIVTDARGRVTMAVEGVGGVERFEQDPVTAPRQPRDPATPGGIWYARFGMTEPRFHAGMQVEQEVSGDRYTRKSQEPRTYSTGNPGGGDAIRGEVLP